MEGCIRFWINPELVWQRRCEISMLLDQDPRTYMSSFLFIVVSRGDVKVELILFCAGRLKRAKVARTWNGHDLNLN